VRQRLTIGRLYIYFMWTRRGRKHQVCRWNFHTFYTNWVQPQNIAYVCWRQGDLSYETWRYLKATLEHQRLLLWIVKQHLYKHYTHFHRFYPSYGSMVWVLSLVCISFSLRPGTSISAAVQPSRHEVLHNGRAMSRTCLLPFWWR